MRGYAAKAIDPNSAVRQQAVAVSEAHKRLYPWCDRLRRLVAQHSQIDLPEVVIGTACLRRTLLGVYIIGRDELQLVGKVIINERYLDVLPLCWNLETLCHEVLHFAEELAGKMSHSTRSSYHTAWYRALAEQIGIPCTREGMSASNVLRADTPFGRLLVRHHVRLERMSEGPEKFVDPPISTTSRWTCGCTNVRAAVALRARCLKCSRRFQRV